MANWSNNNQPSVIREENYINVLELDRARAVSDFIKAFNDSKRRGYDSIIIDFDQVQSVFPNAAVPLAGILQFLQNENDIEIDYENERRVDRFNLLSPRRYTEESRFIMNRVWYFSTSE